MKIINDKNLIFLLISVIFGKVFFQFFSFCGSRDAIFLIGDIVGLRFSGQFCKLGIRGREHGPRDAMQHEVVRD